MIGIDIALCSLLCLVVYVSLLITVAYIVRAFVVLWLQTILKNVFVICRSHMLQ
jgi:hypothetical protein